MALSSGNRPPHKKRANEPIENPISAMFDLAQDVVSQAPYIRRWTTIAIIAVALMVLVVGIVALYYFFQGGGSICCTCFFFGPLTIFGILTLMFLIRIRRYFAYYVKRFAGISAIRDAGVEVKVPKGKTASDRFINYLTEASREFSKFRRFYPASFKKNVKISGASGKGYKFNYVVVKAASINGLFFHVPWKGYTVYVKETKKLPTVKDIVEMENIIQDITDKTKILPSRVILIVPNCKMYDGLSEDLYAYLMQKELTIKINGKPQHLYFQVVVEDDDYYDMVPFIPYVPGELP